MNSILHSCTSRTRSWRLQQQGWSLEIPKLHVARARFVYGFCVCNARLLRFHGHTRHDNSFHSKKMVIKRPDDFDSLTRGFIRSARVRRHLSGLRLSPTAEDPSRAP
jgi:hypothetical protein